MFRSFRIGTWHTEYVNCVFVVYCSFNVMPSPFPIMWFIAEVLQPTVHFFFLHILGLLTITDPQNNMTQFNCIRFLKLVLMSSIWCFYFLFLIVGSLTRQAKLGWYRDSRVRIGQRSSAGDLPNTESFYCTLPDIRTNYPNALLRGPGSILENFFSYPTLMVVTFYKQSGLSI